MALLRPALFFAALLSAPAAAGTTWHVDAAAPCPGTGSLAAPFCSIQAALDTASSGDEILVAPGLYAERLDFSGKDVELRSTAGAAATIVDGGNAGSVVTFANGEGRGALLSGFTVRNGAAFAPDSGGGIVCVGSSPTIADNVILLNVAEVGGGLALLGGSPLVTGNTVRDNFGTYGCGIHCGAGTTAELIGNSILSNGPTGTTGGGIDVKDAAPLIENNLIEGNVTSGGAGISVDSGLVVVVRGNVIRGNSTDEGDGGGLFTSASTLVEDNEIVDNGAVGEGGGVWANGGTFRNNRISGNQAVFGGGVFARAGTSFDGDLIEDNSASLAGGLLMDGLPGGPPIVLTRVTVRGHEQDGVSVLSGLANLEDCLVTGNDQGLMAVGAGTDLTVRRCTFSGNTLSAVVTFDGAHAELVSCIAWGDALASGLELAPETGSIDASWSIIRLGYPGPGNLALDPLFADAPSGDYALLPASPAIDGGDPDDSVSGFDLAGTPRRLDGLLDVGSEVDRGALEFDNVQLATSSPSAGALKIDLAGTAGLQTFILAAPSAGSLRVEKWGTFGLDLSGPWISSPWPGAPSSIPVHVAPSFSGLPIVLQVLAGQPGQLGFTGNLSNAVSIQLP